MTRTNYLVTVWNFVPLILLVLIIEGTYRTISAWLIGAYIIIRTYQVIKRLDDAGYIDLLADGLKGGNKK